MLFLSLFILVYVSLSFVGAKILNFMQLNKYVLYKYCRGLYNEYFFNNISYHFHFSSFRCLN